MSKRKQPKGGLPEKTERNRQYDLFAEFFGHDAHLSNTIELWDAIPKYAVTARRQVNLRDASQRLPVHQYEFDYRGKRCRLEIQPASIKVDGGYQDFYPAADEELVEEVIRKLFATQHLGIHDAATGESWVRFSLQMIRRELRARGKTRSADEIKRSIEILAKTTLQLYVEGYDTPVYTNPILSDLMRVTRAMYLRDTSITWAARLPALISKSINELTYRQFNYGTYMGLRTQLARWLHKRLSHQYVNASLMQSYNILFSTIQRDSGLLEAKRVNANVTALDRALEELCEAEVLINIIKEERRGPRNQLHDILYDLYAHPAFVQEVKAANARQKKGRQSLEEPTLFPTK